MNGNFPIAFSDSYPDQNFKIEIYVQKLSENRLAKFVEEQVLFCDQYRGIDPGTGYWHTDIAMGEG
jgi:hypothetical protein